MAHLKAQGHPAYLDVVVAEEGTDEAKPDPAEDKPVFERSAMGAGDDDSELYDQAVKVVLRDKKCSTSYIQRRLQVGYNKAASLVERMEKEGIVGQAKQRRQNARSWSTAATCASRRAVTATNSVCRTAFATRGCLDHDAFSSNRAEGINVIVFDQVGSMMSPKKPVPTFWHHA